MQSAVVALAIVATGVAIITVYSQTLPTSQTSSIGPEGPTGPTGSFSTGTTGPDGITGLPGANVVSSTGPTGLSPTGPSGISSVVAGVTGPRGATGTSTDPDGSTGPDGPPGLMNASLTQIVNPWYAYYSGVADTVNSFGSITWTQVSTESSNFTPGYIVFTAQVTLLERTQPIPSAGIEFYLPFGRIFGTSAEIWPIAVEVAYKTPTLTGCFISAQMADSSLIGIKASRPDGSVFFVTSDDLSEGGALKANVFTFNAFLPCTTRT